MNKLLFLFDFKFRISIIIDYKIKLNSLIIIIYCCYYYSDRLIINSNIISLLFDQFNKASTDFVSIWIFSTQKRMV